MLGIKPVTHTHKAVFYFLFEPSSQEEGTAYKFLEVLPVVQNFCLVLVDGHSVETLSLKLEVGYRAGTGNVGRTSRDFMGRTSVMVMVKK